MENVYLKIVMQNNDDDNRREQRSNNREGRSECRESDTRKQTASRCCNSLLNTSKNKREREKRWRLGEDVNVYFI